MTAKDRYLQIRVTPEEKAAIQRAASEAGMDMSGWVLGKLFPGGQQRFRQLGEALAGGAIERRYVLAEFNDFLSGLTPAELSQAVAERPAAGLEPFMANYVAAMVETAAHNAGVAPPSWTSAVAPLEEPVFGVPFARLRLHLLLHSPPAFRRRNIFIDASVGERV